MTPSEIEPAIPQPTKSSHDPNQYPDLCILHVDMTILLTVGANKFRISIYLYNMQVNVLQIYVLFVRIQEFKAKLFNDGLRSCAV
jgi:hypothetical protein